MPNAKNATDLILNPESGLLKRISEIRTDNPNAKCCQLALKQVLSYLRNKGAYILDRPDKEKLTRKEHKRLAKLLLYIHKTLPDIRNIYNLTVFIDGLKNHLPLNVLEKLLPSSKKPKRPFAAHR